jgi:hypothetical protein
VVRTYLEDTVPLFLAAYLDANNLDAPDPDEVEFKLVDNLQMVTHFPVVIVRSTDSPTMESDGADTYLVRYEVEVVVGADHTVHDDFEGASQVRDRLQLAVVESLLSLTGLPDGVQIPPRRLSQQTGAAAETLAGQPIAAGVVKFPVIVQETLTVLSPAEDIDAVDLTVTGNPAATTI